MSYNLQNLREVHRAVARELAVGLTLEEICKAKALNITSWRQITTSPLFREEIKRIRNQIEDAIVDDHVDDPARLRLINSRNRAAEVLREELDNHEREAEGATAATRIKAANSILEATGDKDQGQDKGNVVILNLAESVLNKAMDSSRPKDVPIHFGVKDLSHGQAN